MAAPLSPHSRFMAWVHELRGPSPPAADDIDSEAEEDEVIRLLLLHNFTPSRNPSLEPQCYPDPTCFQASSSAVRLVFSEPIRSSSPTSADVKGKRKSTDDRAHSDESTEKSICKRNRSQEPAETEAAPSAPKKHRSRRTKVRSTYKRARGSALNTAPDGNIPCATLPALPVRIAPLVDIDEHITYAGGGEEFHSSDAEPGSYLANGRRRRREIERTRPCDATPLACPLPASTICIGPQRTEPHCTRSRRDSWVYRAMCESGPARPDEGAPAQQPVFPKRKPAPKRNAPKPRTWLAPSAPILELINSTSALESAA